jgi:hypothetical protein
MTELGKWTSRGVVALMGLGFIDGFVAYRLYPGEVFPVSSVIFGLISVFLIFLWFRLDAASRNYPRGPLLSVAVIAIAAIAIPYYLFRSRGLRSGSVATLVFFTVTCSYTLMAWLGQVVGRDARF